MPQITIVTTAEDGYIDNNPLATFKTQNSVIVKAYDSTQTLTSQGYWFFDTSDASTGIPASATITLVEFGYWVSASTLSQASTNEIYWSNQGVWGSTLEDADYHDTSQSDAERHKHPLFLPVIGENVEELQTLGVPGWFINRNGITNVRMYVTEEVPPTQLTIDASEKVGGHPAFLRITYELAAPARLGGYTSYDLGQFDVSQPEAQRLPEESARAWAGDRRHQRQE